MPLSVVIKKEVTIPDISNMSVEEASKLLSSKGLIVNSEYKYVVSETIEEGKVVKSAPSIGTSTKEGNTIILYISSGDKSYTIEDFTGENYLVAKGKIEAKCDCNVTVEKEKVGEKDNKKEETKDAVVVPSLHALIEENFTVVIPGVPNLRAFRAINSSPSGRISKEVIFKCGKCNLASMETDPVQNPISHNDVLFTKSSTDKSAKRIGILVIILLLPFNRWNSESGMPNHCWRREV